MKGAVRISVALCTCDGERFLQEQLDSIRVQDRPPDEVVICDDDSADRTWTIVERFAREAPFPVRPVRNERRLGVAKNFGKVIGLCAGDVIALCDQDDVWRPGKLARLERLFSGDEGVGAAFTDGDVVDESLHPLGYGLWSAHRPNRFQKQCLRKGDAYRALLNRNLATGATMAFRSRYRPLILPVPEGWMHDAWIALLIAAASTVEAVPEPLIAYRRHVDQQVGAPQRGLEGRIGTARRTGSEEYRKIGERYAEALERLRARGGVSPELLRAMEGKIAHAAFRAGERGGSRSPISIAKEFFSGRYRLYSDGWKSALKDLAKAGPGGV